MRVMSSSMSPTLQQGDIIFGIKTKPNRGDIAVFKYNGKNVVKRVIGISGDVISIRKGSVYVNGVYVNERYVMDFGDYSGTFCVPLDSYFVLGDNRCNSKDSRYMDTTYIHDDDIVGKVVCVMLPVFRSLLCSYC